MSSGESREASTYPLTKVIDVVDDHHGTQVADPYRWLEDLDAPETAAWIAEQNRVTSSYLARIPFRTAVRERLEALWEYERRGVPTQAGDRYFWMHEDGVRNQPVLMCAPTLNEEPVLLLDPNTWSADGTVALSGAAISPDGRWVAYGTSDAGSDWQVWRILDVARAQPLTDELGHVKFTQPAWLPDGSAFFYGRYPERTERLEDSNLGQQLYMHRVGTPQDQDELVYERPDHPDWLLFPQVTEDGRWLVITAHAGSANENAVFVARLDDGPIEVRGLLTAFDATYGLIDNDGDAFLIHTDRDAPRGRVVAVDADSPEPARWRELIPEGEHAIQGVGAVGEVLFVHELRDVTSRVRLHARDGSLRGEVPLPGFGTAAGFGGRRDHAETFFAFTSFTVPPTIHRYDLATGVTEVVFTPTLPFDPSIFVTTQVFVRSLDGTRVPMFLTHHRDVTPDGDRPTILYGYGGFRNPIVPAFSLTVLPWLEAGGVFASANIRGGSEYGEAWHAAGTKLQKQNVFDDFIAAAEWLIEEGWTRRERLAIKGASNGGLLVGACLTQRPDLFAAGHIAVGVLDMLRYHRFTIGWAWAGDYGTADDPEEFKALYAYSPLHNIRPGAAYPSLIITTGDHDDRVVPSHSFKFAATIQPAQAGPRPILLRVEVRAGHGMGKPKDKLIAEAADVMAFLLHELGASYDPTSAR